MSEVALSAGMRTNLASLSRASQLLEATQERLATGRKVNSAVDNPTNFFAAANLTDRADLLNSRLDGMGQAVSTLGAADNALTTMRGLVSAMKGVVDEALASSDSADRAVSGKQFNELIVQLNDVAKDASYKGVNLLKSGQAEASMTNGGNETLTVQFNESFDDSTLDIKGVNIRGSESIAVDSNGEIANASVMSGANGSGFAISFNEDGDVSGTSEVIGLRSADITGAEGANQGAAATGTEAMASSISWVDDTTYQTNLKQVVSDLEAFDTALVNTAKSLSQNVNIVSLRTDFTNAMINTLEEGADKLTLADLNEEGANLLALQTSQSLGTQSLALASQSQQGVLQLLG